MKILVPIKRVVDPYAKVRPLADGSNFDTSGVKFEINPFDEIAVEEAVRLRERLSPAGVGIEIVVVTIAGAVAEEQLRKALAMGADRAVLIETDQTYDPPSVALELAEIAKALEPDLILMGKQATDDDSNQVGQMLAAILDWPQATFASKLEITPNVNPITAVVTRETDTGDEIVELTLPALVTADLRLNEPRYIALPGIIKARSKPLEKRPPSRIPNPKTRLVRVWSPPERAAGRKVANVSELLSTLRSLGAVAHE